MGESYYPPPGEYVRPAGRYMIPDPRDDDRFDNHFVRGAEFNPAGFVGLAAGLEVEVELVREPGNPHHAQAIALLVDDVRIGYFGAEIAEEWQSFVIEKNQAGMAVFAQGVIESVAEPKATIFLPWMSTLRRARATQQRAETQRLRAIRAAEAYRLRIEKEMTFSAIAAELECSEWMASKLYREHLAGMPESAIATGPGLAAVRAKELLEAHRVWKGPPEYGD